MAVEDAVGTKNLLLEDGIHPQALAALASFGANAFVEDLKGHRVKAGFLFKASDRASQRSI